MKYKSLKINAQPETCLNYHALSCFITLLVDSHPCQHLHLKENADVMNIHLKVQSNLNVNKTVLSQLISIIFTDVK